MSRIDTQVVELIGRNRLIDELLRAKLEVAVPARDRGVDLIAYADLSAEVGEFVARPIQMKAASESSFSIYKKYERLASLIVAYVWYLEDPKKAVTYALTQREALEVADAMGYTATGSWKEDGVYTTTAPSVELCRHLLPFEMTPDRWRVKVLG
jgi:hypothetical protein